MKLKVQAQHLQPGDIVGSGEVVKQIVLNSNYKWPSNKVCVVLFKTNQRTVYWGKYTEINVERVEKVASNG